MSTLSSLFKQTFRYLSLFPLPLMGLQAFDLVSEVVLSFVEDPKASHLLYAVGFPLVWFMTVFASAATFEFLRQTRGGAAPSLQATVRAMSSKFWSLIKTEAIAGVAVMVGLLIIVPGLYFLTIYLFVPCFIMALPRSSAFTYLAESKSLTRGRFWPLFALSITIVALSVGLNELQNIWDSLNDAFLMRVVPKAFFSLALSAAINTFISVCYFHFTESALCSTPLPNASTK